MAPELKLNVDFPGFGSVEITGLYGETQFFQEVAIDFTPSQPGNDLNGLIIRICRNGKCYVQELKPLEKEDRFDGIGIS